MKPKLIAVTGGIGSGKSVVSAILRLKGYPVYDTDTEAKRLMDASPAIKAAISAEICDGAIDSNGNINRRKLASSVFAETSLLEKLNSLVHSAVARDIMKWVEAHHSETLLFIETALLYQSSLDRLVDEVWEVTAPNHTRVTRVMARNGMSLDEVNARIDSQDRYTPEKLHGNIKTLINDGLHAVIPQVEFLLGS